MIKNNNSVVIIGSGLAGLATSIKLKLDNPDREVVIVEKKHPQSNSQIAGMRIRARESGKGLDPISEVEKLLKRQNGGLDNKRFGEFAVEIGRQIEFWRSAHAYIKSKHGISIPPLSSADHKDWFGPQWGEGRGKGNSVLSWFRNLAGELEISRITGEVVDIERDGQTVDAVKVKNESGEGSPFFKLRAGVYVLATGSIGGSLYNSTNKKIDNSAAELAYRANIPLVGSTTNMFHPFGRSTTEGKPKLGCYETDALAGAEVIFKDGTVDLETTKLLNNHRAHYEFPEICQRFYKNGSVVGLRMPGGGLNTARVSHHYSQLGIDTTDGVSVRGINNLYAIGDSEGWTLSNYGLRLPGFGIAKSLNDAELVSKRHNSTEYIPRNLARENITTEIIGNGRLEDNEKLSKIIRTINTDSLLDLNFSDRPKREICDDWYDKLADLGASESAVWEISLGVARIHRLRTEGNIREPFSLTKDFVRSFDYELKGANELPYLNNNVEHSTRAGWRR